MNSKQNRQTQAELERRQKEKIEFMRQQVQELELQSRYWKAQWETKFYTLEDNKIKADYDTFIIKTQEEYLNQLNEQQAQYEASQELEPSLTQNNEEVSE